MTAALVYRAEGDFHPFASGQLQRRCPRGAAELGPGAELVGYYGYDSVAELTKLNEIWALDAQFTKYFLPQRKLVFKQLNGAKVAKRHDTATTPHQRAMRQQPSLAGGIDMRQQAFGAGCSGTG